MKYAISVLNYYIKVIQPMVLKQINIDDTQCSTR